MEKGCRKDLDALKNAFKHNDPVPKFNYENKTFSMVQWVLPKIVITSMYKLLECFITRNFCENLISAKFTFVRCNTDLGDNDLEITIVRGIQYSPPESK